MKDCGVRLMVSTVTTVVAPLSVEAFMLLMAPVVFVMVLVMACFDIRFVYCAYKWRCSCESTWSRLLMFSLLVAWFAVVMVWKRLQHMRRQQSQWWRPWLRAGAFVVA